MAKYLVFEEFYRLMKKLFSIAVLLMLAASFTSVSAQKKKSKDDLFKEIATLSNTKVPEDSEKAYQLSKEFLSRFGMDKDERVPKIRNYYNNYRQQSFYNAVEGKKYSDAFLIGKEILAEQPENTEVLMNLAFAGYNAFIGTRDKTFNDDSAAFAKKTLQLFEAGKLPAAFAPFKDQEEAIAFMNYVAGALGFEKDMKDAVTYIYQSTLHQSVIKNSSESVYLIATYYEALYETVSTDMKAKVAAKTISDAAVNTEMEKVGKILDLMMDAYARAFKRGEAEKNPSAVQWKQRLAQVYKFRKNTDAGLTEYINYITTTALPAPAKF